MSSQRLAYKKFPRGETCGEPGCLSKRYYVQDGRAFCKAHDHIWPEWRQVEQDDDDFGTQGRKTRVKRTQQHKVKKVLEGSEARELFYGCWQLILWKQVSWLTKPKEEGGVGLPQELREVVKALWTMRLKGLVKDETAEDLDFSSQSEITEFESGGDTSGTEKSGSSRRLRHPRRSTKRLTEIGITLMETVALCYLGIVLLKLPVSVGEFYNWIEKGEIIFIEGIRFIPKEMRSSLPGHFRKPFHTVSIPKPDSLHKTILGLSTILNELSNIQFPSLNHRLLTFYHVKKLGLPLEIYLSTQKLAKILDLDFGFPTSECRRLFISLSPEVKIICLIIIATKLAYPFSPSSHLRPPRKLLSQSDPATLRLDWQVWREVMVSKNRGIRKAKGKAGLVKGMEVRVTDQDALRMNGKEVDDYLDWHHMTLKYEPDDENQRKPIPYAFLRLFPLPSRPDPSITSPTQPQPTQTQTSPGQDFLLRSTSPANQEIKAIHSSLTYQPLDPAPDPAGAREINHVHYRTVTDLPEDAKAFYEVVAHQSSLSLPNLVHAVFSMERKLVEWMLAERRRKFHDNNNNDKEIGSEEEYWDDGDDDGLGEATVRSSLVYQ